MSIGYTGKVFSVNSVTQKKVSENVVAYIAEHASTAALVAGRATVGMLKRLLFQRGLTCTLSASWREIAEAEELPTNGIPVVVLLRGGGYVIPPNLESVMGHSVITDIGLKVRRFQDDHGGWHAKVDVAGSYGLEKLKGATVVIIVDECGASGSTPKGTIEWLRENIPTLRKVIFICPLLGDIALKRVMSVNFPVVTFSFGIFKVLPKGWKRPETDIVVPKEDDGSGLLAIPDMVLQICKQVYGFGENGCTGCVAGDATKTMSGNSYVQVAELAEAGEWWCAKNGTMPPLEIWNDLTQLLGGMPNGIGGPKQKALTEMLSLLLDGPDIRRDRPRCMQMFQRQQELWQIACPGDMND